MATKNSIQNVHVRGSLFSNYDGYCPITEIQVFQQPDGSWVSGIYEQIVVSEDEFIFSPGFLVVMLGAIRKDYTLETAADALFNSLKSLFAACDTPVDLVHFRTTVELSEYMKVYRDNYSHVILIGHGQKEGISFLDKPKPIGGSELAGCLGADASNKSLQIISLCCHSGCESLSMALSSAPNISEVLAPNDAFDIRWTVHFITGFFLYMYIDGLPVDDAVKNAAQQSGNAPMCIWRKGKLVGDCRVNQVESTVELCDARDAK